jgi:hypothetical protein
MTKGTSPATKDYYIAEQSVSGERGKWKTNFQ